jgi:phosphoglucan,water dikinase
MACHWNKTKEPLDLLGTSEIKLSGDTEKEIDEDAKLSGNIALEEMGNIGNAGDGNLTPELESSTLGGLWQGSDTVFMRSNEHRNNESDRKWDMTGLDAVSLKLVEGDKASRNWWRKVSWINSLFFLVKWVQWVYSFDINTWLLTFW